MYHPRLQKSNCEVVLVTQASHHPLDIFPSSNLPIRIHTGELAYPLSHLFRVSLCCLNWWRLYQFKKWLIDTVNCSPVVFLFSGQPYLPLDYLCTQKPLISLYFNSNAFDLLVLLLITQKYFYLLLVGFYHSSHHPPGWPLFFWLLSSIVLSLKDYSSSPETFLLLQSC